MLRLLLGGSEKGRDVEGFAAVIFFILDGKLLII
jgi:hypothetical protein